MIVPRLRLILLTAFTVIPLLGLAESRPGDAWAIFGALGFMVFLCGGDAYIGRKRLQFLRAELPERLRWIQDRPAQMDVAFVVSQPIAGRVQAALVLPMGIASSTERFQVDLPGPAGRHLVSCECRPTRRGLFRIAGCHFEISSPLGLWDVRGRAAQVTEVRVYPNLEAERKQVAALFLRTRHSGLQAIRQVGQGRDFEKLREYVPGDGYDTIHWKATARRGHPITKVYQIEKTQEIYVIIDASRLSARLQVPGDPSQGTRLDRYLAASLMLGLAAGQQGDLFGLVTFSNSILSFVRARNGKEHYSACREALYRLEPQSVSPDFEELATFISLRLRRRALLIFMTDLDDPVLMESFQRAAEILRRKHLVVVHMLRPDTIHPLFTTDRVKTPQDIYGDLAGHLTWHDLRQLSLDLAQQGVHLSLFSQERFSAEAISEYFRIKQRQLL